MITKFSIDIILRFYLEPLPNEPSKVHKETTLVLEQLGDKGGDVEKLKITSDVEQSSNVDETEEEQTWSYDKVLDRRYQNVVAPILRMLQDDEKGEKQIFRDPETKTKTHFEEQVKIDQSESKCKKAIAWYRKNEKVLKTHPMVHHFPSPNKRVFMFQNVIKWSLGLDPSIERYIFKIPLQHQILQNFKHIIANTQKIKIFLQDKPKYARFICIPSCRLFFFKKEEEKEEENFKDAVLVQTKVSLIGHGDFEINREYMLYLTNRICPSPQSPFPVAARTYLLMFLSSILHFLLMMPFITDIKFNNLPFYLGGDDLKIAFIDVENEDSREVMDSGDSEHLSIGDNVRSLLQAMIPLSLKDELVNRLDDVTDDQKRQISDIQVKTDQESQHYFRFMSVLLRYWEKEKLPLNVVLDRSRFADSEFSMGTLLSFVDMERTDYINKQHVEEFFTQLLLKLKEEIGKDLFSILLPSSTTIQNLRCIDIFWVKKNMDNQKLTTGIKRSMSVDQMKDSLNYLLSVLGLYLLTLNLVFAVRKLNNSVVRVAKSTKTVFQNNDVWFPLSTQSDGDMECVEAMNKRHHCSIQF